jgi:hypothetical protein
MWGRAFAGYLRSHDSERPDVVQRIASGCSDLIAFENAKWKSWISTAHKVNVRVEYVLCVGMQPLEFFDDVIEPADRRRLSLS